MKDRCLNISVGFFCHTVGKLQAYVYVTHCASVRISCIVHLFLQYQFSSPLVNTEVFKIRRSVFSVMGTENSVESQYVITLNDFSTAENMEVLGFLSDKFLMCEKTKLTK